MKFDNSQASREHVRRQMGNNGSGTECPISAFGNPMTALAN